MIKENYNTGISSEVYTIKSKIRLIDIFNSIIDKKAEVILDLLNKLSFKKTIKKEDNIIIIGTYFTGIGIGKILSLNEFKNITIIDIYPHLEEFIDSNIGGDLKRNIKFSSNLDLIPTGDIIIDTTGLGGITEEQSSKFNPKLFIIEDPIAEDNDKSLNEKNNIYSRLESVNSENKYILKTLGLNTKTSGTMTLTIDVLRQTMDNILKKEGVLYCACEMRFFEEIIFKENNIKKFLNISNSPAIKVSTISIFECDREIENILDKIHSKIISEYM